MGGTNLRAARIENGKAAAQADFQLNFIPPTGLRVFVRRAL